jgi:antibiotic biosynthesis monooxygenase (ABM) superfamily enzyme
MKNHINKNDERSKEYLTIIAGILIVGIFLNEYILPKLPKLSLLIFFGLNTILVILIIYYLIRIINV